MILAIALEDENQDGVIDDNDLFFMIKDERRLKRQADGAVIFDEVLEWPVPVIDYELELVEVQLKALVVAEDGETRVFGVSDRYRALDLLVVEDKYTLGLVDDEDEKTAGSPGWQREKRSTGLTREETDVTKNEGAEGSDAWQRKPRNEGLTREEAADTEDTKNGPQKATEDELIEAVEDMMYCSI